MTVFGLDLTFNEWHRAGVVIVLGGVASWTRTTIVHQLETTLAWHWRTHAWNVLLLRSTTTTTQQQAPQKEPLNVSQQEQPKEGKHASQTPTDSTALSTSTTTPPLSPAAVSTLLDATVTRMAHGVTTAVVNGLRSSSAVVYSTLQLLALDAPLFAGVVVGLLPSVGYLAVLLRRSQQQHQQRALAAQQEATEFVQERWWHRSWIDLANRQDEEIQTYRRLQHTVQQHQQHYATAKGRTMGFLFVAGASSVLAVIQYVSGRHQHSSSPLPVSRVATHAFLLALGTAGVATARSEWKQGWAAAHEYWQVLRPVRQSPTTRSQPQTQPGNEQDDQERHRLLAQAAVVPSQYHENDIHNNHQSSSLVEVDPRDVVGLRVQGLCFSYPKQHDNNNTDNKDDKDDKPGTMPPSSSSWSLRDVSLDVPRGFVVAVVGPNGSGKTTLASLVAGLLEPTAGSIQWQVDYGRPSMDDTDKDKDEKDMPPPPPTPQYHIEAQRLTRTCWHELVHLVPQRPPLWNDTVAYNVQYTASRSRNYYGAQPQRDQEQQEQERLQAALHLTHCQDLQWTSNNSATIENTTTTKENTTTSTTQPTIGPNGSYLSGGQCQRVALARALYAHSCCLLILDEPSSSLDSAQGEEALTHVLQCATAQRRRRQGQSPSMDPEYQESMSVLQQDDDDKDDRAVLLIVHSAKTLVEWADSIVVLNAEGRVVQQGTLSELTATPSTSFLCELMPDLVSFLPSSK